MLRVNVVTRTAVIPAAPTPSELDRWIDLKPGTLTESQVDAAIDAAIGRADAAERAWVEQMGPRLAKAMTGEGTCRRLEETDGSWALLLKGYTIRAEPTGEGCAVSFEPDPIQHRRRFRGWVGASGILSPEDWPGG